MKKIYKIVLLLAFLVIIALIILFLYTKDEKVYTLKSYYPDTKVTDVSQYVIRNGDTVFNGKFIQYNEKKNKIAEGNFVNGEMHGKCVYYFDSGKIKSIHYAESSKIKVESIWNYPEGKIRKYMTYNDFGEPIFIVNYDELGNIKSYSGLPFIEIYQYKIAHKEQFKTMSNQVLKVGDVLKYKYLLANIPNSKRDFKIELLDSDNTKIKRTITKKPPLEIDVEEVLTKKGKNAIKAVVEYKFSDINKTVVKDSVYFEVIVN